MYARGSIFDRKSIDVAYICIFGHLNDLNVTHILLGVKICVSPSFLRPLILTLLRNADFRPEIVTKTFFAITRGN